MSTRAVTMIIKHYPDVHLFDWTKMSWCQTEGTQDIDVVWFLIKEVPNFCLVSRFPQNMSCKSTCVYYCPIRIVKKECNDMLIILSHSTYKFYSPEFRWWVICVDPANFVNRLIEQIVTPTQNKCWTLSWASKFKFDAFTLHTPFRDNDCTLELR